MSRSVGRYSPHTPTGESYRAGTILDMARIPDERGQRTRFLGELPMILKTAEEAEDMIVSVSAKVRSRRPWWAFWMTPAVAEKLMRKHLIEKAEFVDDGKGRYTLKTYEDGLVSEETRSLHEGREEPKLLFYYVQLEGTEKGEEGDVFWAGVFITGKGPNEILDEAEELEAGEGSQFHSGRVMRAYGPFTASLPAAERGA